jgi:glycosyltransferase involved in cell wall biosynthesis
LNSLILMRNSSARCPVESHNPHIKFSIVTPTFNAGKHLDQTISSVLSQQGDLDVEYIIVDNESTDNTLAVAEDHRAQLGKLNRCRRAGQVSMKIVSTKDNGMYEAINRGFSMASGEIFAWINADDLYLPDAFTKIAGVFSTLPEVKWLKGITSYIDERGENLTPGKCYLYAQELIKRGLYGREAYFIQQDSVFWRSSLWASAGCIDTGFKLAGDYDLWLKFAQSEPLYSLNAPVSCFRQVKGQLSEDLSAYREEQRRIQQDDDLKTWLLRRFFATLEPKLPNWLKFSLFRVLCPCEPLYYIDGVPGAMTIKTSSKYMV